MIFLIITVAMIITLVLLRRHLPIGVAILAGGLFIWLCTDPTIKELTDSVQLMVSRPRNYDLVGALYLVICLEIELRKSGCLAGMVEALSRMFASRRFTLAVMPAFLGLLPSVGGARFSAPIVQEASKGFDATPEDKAAINFWFRHIFEFSSPLVPGMILACGIAGVKIGDLIVHLGWLTIVAFLIGWFVIVRGIKQTSDVKANVSEEDIKRMVREAEEHSAEDKKFEELATARNRADATVHAMRKQLQDVGANVSADDKAKVEKALSELELAIRGDDKDKIENAEKAVLQAGQTLMQAAQAQAQAQQASQQQANAGAGAQGGQKKDDVVDAEFEEVKDDKK